MENWQGSSGNALTEGVNILIRSVSINLEGNAEENDTELQAFQENNQIELKRYVKLYTS